MNSIPDNKVHGANMGPTWVLSAPDGPHVGPMNLAIRDAITKTSNCLDLLILEHRILKWIKSGKKQLHESMMMIQFLETYASTLLEAFQIRKPCSWTFWHEKLHPLSTDRMTDSIPCHMDMVYLSFLNSIPCHMHMVYLSFLNSIPCHMHMVYLSFLNSIPCHMHMVYLSFLNSIPYHMHTVYLSFLNSIPYHMHMVYLFC